MKKNFILIIICLFIFSGCSANNINDSEIASVKQNDTEVNDKSIPVDTEKSPPEEYSVSLVAVGDNLYHSPINRKGYNNGTYNFDFVYNNISDFIKNFDLAIVNQETVFVDHNDISSYPCFGTPEEAGDALINAGFNIFLGATNHAFDKKENGILYTIDFYKKHPEIDYVGLNENIDEYNSVKIIDKNNIKIAILNYTYGLNGFVIPDNEYYLVNTLYDKEKIKNDLEYAEQNADITIVFPHWGTEYVYEETDMQKEWADFFTEYGADIIIGTHPHVCEPVKYITSENGNSSLCYYSLGNFVSGQNEKPRILGGIATVNIIKTVDGENVTTKIENPSFIPCVTHYNYNEHTIYLLKNYTDELAYNSKLQATPDYLWDLWYNINNSSEIDYQKK